MPQKTMNRQTRQEPRRSALARQLYKHIRNCGAVRFRRDSFDDSALFGFPLQMSEQLVLVYEFQGLLPTGFVILRFDDIDALAVNRPDRSVEQAIRGRMPPQQLPAPPGIDLRSWRTVCACLAGEERVVEVVGEHEKRLYVGNVLHAGVDSLLLHGLDQVGFWDSEHTEIAYSRITRLHLPEHYFCVLH